MWDSCFPTVATVILLQVFFSAVAVAGDVPTASDAQLASNEPDAPSLDLLEYLGEFQTEDGQWIDPVNLLTTELSDAKANDEEDSNE